MPLFEFPIRRSILEPERIWRLEDDGLSCASEDGIVQVPYRDIRMIRLQWSATRFDDNRHSCEILGPNGVMPVLVSTHYAGPMQFEDRRAGYVPFIRQLLRRAHAANPQCRFIAGSSGGGYMFNIVALIGAILLFAFVLLLTGLPLTAIILIKLVLIAVLLPKALRWLRVNQPRDFHPDTPPPEVLPAL